MATLDDGLVDAAVLDLTTRGRRTGQPRTIEIWFAARGSTIYLLAGGREAAHWVRNIVADPAVSIAIRGRPFVGRGRLVRDPVEGDVARDALVAKYQPRYGGDLSGWRAASLPVAIELADEAWADDAADPAVRASTRQP